jgi:S-adenosyl-L-methionine hydrolase (adenosine-forming)
MRVITLLTDFGLEDGYVAAMKGVIAGIAPEAQVVDVTHLVPPQDIASARFRLLTVAPFFPPGTIHVAVVDPGVGTARPAVAIRCRSGSCLVGPDNGLLCGALEADPPLAVVHLTDPRFWRTAAPSATFHGRDVFAPVGAHLARGVTLEALGPAVPAEGLLTLGLQPPTPVSGGVVGAVQATDRFGNVISNVPGGLLPGGGAWRASIGGRILPGHRTYADVPPGEPLALVGSHGFIELAVHRGDARNVLGASLGDRVAIHWA